MQQQDNLCSILVLLLHTSVSVSFSLASVMYTKRPTWKKVCKFYLHRYNIVTLFIRALIVFLCHIRVITLYKYF